MAKVSEKMQKLFDLREGFRTELTAREREVEALKNKIRGIEAAIAAMNGTEIANDPRRVNRRNVKKTVMGIIADAQNEGVNAQFIVDQAEVAGRQLDRGSVSSLLSRLKREGVLRFDGEHYFPIGLRDEKPNLKIVNH